MQATPRVIPLPLYTQVLAAILLDVGRITPATELIALQSQSEVTSPTEPQPS